MCKYLKRRGRLLAIGLLFIIIASMLSGCKLGKDDDKVRDLEFSVVGATEEPEELQSIIREKKERPFKLTYSDDANLYIVVGYGPQNTGGYSIAVEELYLTDNAIVIDTELQGPVKGEPAAPETSYPYIVIKTGYLENPVIFE